MPETAKSSRIVLVALSLVLISGGTELLQSRGTTGGLSAAPARIPFMIAHRGPSESLDRPPVPFDHDLHTTALNATTSKDCATCHVLKQADGRLSPPEAKVFGFPKTALDETDKAAVMVGFHTACVSCHRKMAAEKKKTGPDIGLCGSCHVIQPKVQPVTWNWSPIFTYVRHGKHVQAVEKLKAGESFNIAPNVEVIGQTAGKKCELCHHTFDTARKKLIYKKDTENSCGACHKDKDEKNARSLQKVAHAACIGCHMQLAESVKAEMASEGRNILTEQDKKRFGPFDCKGCHGEHKKVTPEEIATTPRLVRGQKDVMDLVLVVKDQVVAPAGQFEAPGLTPHVRMKAVPFNHKSHEPRAQFCNTCHHHSLEKCANCHTPKGDSKKGAGVSYERAFHRAESRQACAGCHAEAKQEAKCAGCHRNMPNPLNTATCAACHRGASDGKIVEVPPLPFYQDKEKVPDKLQIKVLEKEYKPAELPHLKIVNKLVSISNESSLARWFHATKEQALCEGCHHRSELQQAVVKMPKCITCHNRPFDPNALGRPGLMGAYHRQCTGCHQSMQQKPAALECVKCHPAKDVVQTAGIIPPVPSKH
jgi:hypothetical protein